MLIERLYLNAGAMKAGTTWLYSVLCEHPDIYFTYEKEIHYFAHVHTEMKLLGPKARFERFQQVIAKADPAKLDGGAMRRKLLWYANYISPALDDLWYANLFAFKGRQAYCADFSNLTCHLGASGWAHVRRIAGTVRVVYLLREPLSRIWSHIRFHAQIIGEIDRIPHWSPGEMLAFAERNGILKNGGYARCLATMRDHLDASELLVLFSDALHSDPRAMLAGIEDFLGIARHDFAQKRLNSRVNESKAVARPPYFESLFRPHVIRELDALDRMKIGVPAAWHDAVAGL